MRFRDRKHQLAVQAAERNDATAQGLIKEFCELINFPYQQQQGLFAVGFYHSLLPNITPRQTSIVRVGSEAAGDEEAMGETVGEAEEEPGDQVRGKSGNAPGKSAADAAIDDLLDEPAETHLEAFAEAEGHNGESEHHEQSGHTIPDIQAEREPSSTPAHEPVEEPPLSLVTDENEFEPFEGELAEIHSPVEETEPGEGQPEPHLGAPHLEGLEAGEFHDEEFHAGELHGGLSEEKK
jgi:hypothetical protein